MRKSGGSNTCNGAPNCGDRHDGIYVDIPYWMTHFEGWETSWASFDDYTVAAFKEKTGLDAKKDLKLGDF